MKEINEKLRLELEELQKVRSQILIKLGKDKEKYETVKRKYEELTSI